MAPHDVGKVLGKERVLVAGQPFGEHFSAVLAGGVRRDATEELRRHIAVAHGMPHAAAAAVINYLLAVVLASLTTDLREEVCEAVIIIHRPTVEGMIVALGALNAHAHENLRGIFHQL